MATRNKPKCCAAAEETNTVKRIFKKIWTFFFGCNCH